MAVARIIGFFCGGARECKTEQTEVVITEGVPPLKID